MAEGKLPALREEMFVAVTLALECRKAIRATTSAKTMWKGPKDAQGIDPVTAHRPFCPRAGQPHVAGL